MPHSNLIIDEKDHADHMTWQEAVAAGATDLGFADWRRSKVGDLDAVTVENGQFRFADSVIPSLLIAAKSLTQKHPEFCDILQDGVTLKLDEEHALHLHLRKHRVATAA